jgi:hypothetical protein
MVFEAQALAPGPGTRSAATFRWHSIQAALSGSRFFNPPPLVEVMILKILIFLFHRFLCRLTVNRFHADCRGDPVLSGANRGAIET